MFVSKVQRVERSLNEVERLRTECLAWTDMRHVKDVNKQYQTQLNALSELVERACSVIKSSLSALDDSYTLDQTFDQCRFLDQRTAWTRRLWEYFQEKFDQRDGPHGAILLAADEVIWSSYRQPFELLAGKLAPGASPLPYIEPYLSPAAYPRDIFPPGLTAEDKDFRRRFNKLPIPLVRLSPLSVNEPWWLIYSAHEAGHQVEYDLELVDEFKMAVEEAVSDSRGGSPELAALWSSWSREIFADIYSIGAVGPQAALAMADAEYGIRDHMLDRTLDGYPAPLVRLTLLDSVAERFGFERQMEDILQELKTNLAPISPEIENDLALVPLILDTAFDKLQSQNLKLTELLAPAPNFYARGGELENWAYQLRGSSPLNVGELQAARNLTAAAYKAWTDILTDANGAVPDEALRKNLAETTMASMQQSRQSGTRASLDERALDEDVLGDLADLLVSPNTQLPTSLKTSA